MIITGEKVRIRDRVPADSAQEIAWSLDREIIMLDPSAGQTFNASNLSIETLDSKLIGLCSLYNWNSEDVQLGVRVGDKNYWGKGYGTEVVNLLTSYAFSQGIKRVWLKVLPSNFRAIKCYEKCGFVHTGRLALDGYDFYTMEIRHE